jgi:hypothetical protein
MFELSFQYGYLCTTAKLLLQHINVYFYEQCMYHPRGQPSSCRSVCSTFWEDCHYINSYNKVLKNKYLHNFLHLVLHCALEEIINCFYISPE